MNNTFFAKILDTTYKKLVVFEPIAMIQSSALVFIALLLPESELTSYLEEGCFQQLLVLLRHVQSLHLHFELFMCCLLGFLKGFRRLSYWYIPISILPILLCTLPSS